MTDVRISDEEMSARLHRDMERSAAYLRLRVCVPTRELADRIRDAADRVAGGDHDAFLAAMGLAAQGAIEGWIR